jgi:AdoMet-dependent heme synthase
MNKPTLYSLFLSPSHRCNANCVHCYEKFPGKENASLSTREIKNILRQFREMGGDIVRFCSGEFLLLRQSVSILRYTRELGMKPVITTNGLLLTKRKITALKNAGVEMIIVSIDSPNPDEHDRMRGIKGCFAQAVKGLQFASAAGIKTQIYTYVSRSNQNNLSGLAQLAKQNGAEITFVFFPILSGHLFNKPHENLTFQEREALRKIYANHPDIQLEFRTETDVCRGGGNKHVCVMPTGDVTFCPPVPYSYGNIRNEPLKDIVCRVYDDFLKFCTHKCTGQCIVNFPEYRQNCNAKLMYKGHWF